MSHLDYADVLDRSQVIRAQHDITDRRRIRDVMNGGSEGVQSILNSTGPASPKHGLGSGKGADPTQMYDLPTANFIWSGLEKMAQRIGRPPTLKTDMVPIKDSEQARKRSEKRGRIVTAWDDIDRMAMQYPQIGRWITGYGWTFHNICEHRFGNEHYPTARLRDPYDVYYGTWGPTQQPTEAVVVRHVSKKAMRTKYPDTDEPFRLKEQQRQAARKQAHGVVILGSGGNWEGSPHDAVELIEYYCADGTYLICPEAEIKIGFVPNPLDSGPTFVATKRFSFDKPSGQYKHTFGLMAMIAKLNILGLIGAEDANFRETNIIGELIGDTYERGRFAVNLFEPGTTIEKPTSDQLQQTWQAATQLERQFRIVAGYDVAQDGQSPTSWTTGEGVRELGSSVGLAVKEYQVALSHSMELVDAKRLEWEDKMHPAKKKNVYWYEGSKTNEETYLPKKDIQGDYRTNRVYGAMATFDEAQKIVTGLQLVQARILDRRSLQDELDGFRNNSLINERIDQDQAKEMLIQSLGTRAAQGDPAADMALIEILDKPKEATTTLKKLFTPQEPQMSAEEMALVGAGGGDTLEGGPPPPVQTILAQMETPGGGVQSVGRM